MNTKIVYSTYLRMPILLVGIMLSISLMLTSCQSPSSNDTERLSELLTNKIDVKTNPATGEVTGVTVDGQEPDVYINISQGLMLQSPDKSFRRGELFGGLAMVKNTSEVKDISMKVTNQTYSFGFDQKYNENLNKFSPGYRFYNTAFTNNGFVMNAYPGEAVVINLNGVPMKESITIPAMPMFKSLSNNGVFNRSVGLTVELQPINAQYVWVSVQNVEQFTTLPTAATSTITPFHVTPKKIAKGATSVTFTAEELEKLPQGKAIIHLSAQNVIAPNNKTAVVASNMNMMVVDAQ